MINEQDLELYFKEDLELGFLNLGQDQGLEASARQAASKISASDRGRTSAEVGERPATIRGTEAAFPAIIRRSK